MRIDLGRVLSSTFSICWRHRWLWLLGVFGGGGGVGAGFRVGFNYRPSLRQVNGFTADYNGLLVLIALVLLAIFVLGFVLTCIAVPACIWAGLNIDGNRPAGLGDAWHQGLRWFWSYFRLYLVRGLIGLAFLTVIGLGVFMGISVYAANGTPALPTLLAAGLVGAVVLLLLYLVIEFLFTWSERTMFLLDLGAIEALRRSAWLARTAFGDTLVFAVVMGVVTGMVGVGVTVVALVLSIPGVLVLLAGVSAASLSLEIAGVVLATVLGGGALVLGGGFAGSLVQVGYALACRDLCHYQGLELDPGIPPRHGSPTRLTPHPPSLA